MRLTQRWEGIGIATWAGRLPVKAWYHARLWGFYALARRRQRGCLVCLPAPPARIYSLWAVAKVAGLRLVAEPCRGCPGGCAVIVHHDVDVVETVEGALNGRCTDIRKRHVEALTAAAFGYTSFVDPTVWTGPLVDKSDANSREDARIVVGPLEASELREGRVYQRLIETADAQGRVGVLRTGIVAGRIVWVERRWRPTARRFVTGHGLGQERLAVEDAFDAREHEAILAVSAAMGLDFGELDLLRDRADGRLYLIDVNKTPSAMPPKTFKRARRKLALVRESAAALAGLVGLRAIR